MGEHQLKERRERAIASEIGHELFLKLPLSPAMQPEASTENQTVVEMVFTRIFDQYQPDEASARRILRYVSKEWAKLNFEFAERNRQLEGKTL